MQLYGAIRGINSTLETLYDRQGSRIRSQNGVSGLAAQQVPLLAQFFSGAPWSPANSAMPVRIHRLPLLLSGLVVLPVALLLNSGPLLGIAAPVAPMACTATHAELLKTVKALCTPGKGILVRVGARGSSRFAVGDAAARRRVDARNPAIAAALRPLPHPIGIIRTCTEQLGGSIALLPPAPPHRPLSFPSLRSPKPGRR
jgi:hypothetical protein